MKETSHRCSYEELLDLWTDPEGTTVDQVLQGTVRLLPSLLSDTAARNIRHGCPFQEEAIQARIVIVDAPCESDHEGPLTDCACPVYWSSSRGDEDLEGMVHLSAVIPSPFQSPIGKMQVFVPGPLESDRSEEGEEEEPMGNAITQRLEDLAKRLGRVLANGWKLEDRNKTIKALQAKERRLVESQIIARIGQWELDLTTNHLRWSDEIYNLFQIDKEKFGASYEAFLNAIHPDDRAFVDQAYTNSLKTKQPYKILHRLLFADGSTRWVQESCRTEYDAHTGKPLYSVGIVQDITELKQAQELDRLKSAFLANMSHEIRTPLNAVMGYTDLMLMDCQGLSQQQKDYLKTIRNSGELLMTIISDILDFSRIEAGQLHLESKPFSLSEILDLCGRTARGYQAISNRNKHLKLVDLQKEGLQQEQTGDDASASSSSTSKSSMEDCIGDPTRIQQVLNNLLHNAIKFTKDEPGGRVEFGATLTHRCGPMDGDSDDSGVDADPASPQEPQWIVFHVRDNGEGIPEDKQQEVFKAFHQAHPTRDSHELGGTGLGLTISKRLVELMGGTMWLKSSVKGPDRGTLFCVCLPYRRAFARDVPAPERGMISPATTKPAVCFNHPALPMSADEATVGPVASTASTTDSSQSTLQPVGKVLVVDDNLVNLKLAVRLVNRLGFETETAMNGQEAVDAFAKDPGIRLILMDKEMPVMDGLEAVREIRRLEKEDDDDRENDANGDTQERGIPVIALTAAAYPEDKEACLAAGCDSYMTKPVKREALQGVLHTFMHNGVGNCTAA